MTLFKVSHLYFCTFIVAIGYYIQKLYETRFFKTPQLFQLYSRLKILLACTFQTW